MDTQIPFVLGPSGSMSTIADDTKWIQHVHPGATGGGRYGDGDACKFDTSVTPLYEAIPLSDTEVDQRELHTGRADSAPRRSLDGDTEHRRPGRDPAGDRLTRQRHYDDVDRQNASETPQEQIQDLLGRYREEHDWEFLFIGANQDAALTAEQIGMDGNSLLIMSHSGEGAQAAYESTSRAVSDARQGGRTGGYSKQDRKRQRDADGG